MRRRRRTVTRKKRKFLLLFILLFLGIGFSSISTNLYLNGTTTLSKNNSDINIRFTSARIGSNNISGDVISQDGQTITYTATDTTTIDFKIANYSSEYDTNVSVSCTTGTNNGAYTVTSTVGGSSTATIYAKNKKSGQILITKNSGESSETITCTLNASLVERTSFGTPDTFYEATYSYTGDVQEFVAPETGIYKLETWGAQGGKVESGYDGTLKTGGYGGYSTVRMFLERNERLYIYVGQEGATSPTECTKSCDSHYPATRNSFNGGGSGDANCNTLWGGGGGATHIATTSGLLSELSNSIDSIIIVAGAGGGAGSDSNGGSGGGYIGNKSPYSSSTNCGNGGYGGTQTSGGIATSGSSSGVFGHGGFSYGASGGAGFYGGAGAWNCGASGGGGSGYIGNNLVFDKHMACYNCETSDEISTKTISNQCHSSTPTSDCAKEGNGYAKITLVSEEFDYTGNVQEFMAPKTGTYKVELWGAQGGEYDSINSGGRGGYTSGIINLKLSDVLHVYVGGVGYCGLGQGPLVKGGYNGGGDANIDAGSWANRNFCSGAGATDVRLKNGAWNSFESLKSRIMIAGGGGGANYYGSYSAFGGNAGGLTGYRGEGNGSLTTGNYSIGGSQSEGYAFGFGDSESATTNGGGSGYYGGFSLTWSGGGGGSSFISGHSGCNAIDESSTENNIIHTGQADHYSGKKFNSTLMIDGAGCKWTTEKTADCSGQPQPDGTTSTGHTGNGYARITFIE